MGKEHWFFGCRTERETKKRFHELMLIHHPDRGGNLQICQEIVGQYREALKSCQYTGAEWNGQHQAYRYDETLEKEFEEAMNWAMTLSFCKIELIGNLGYGLREKRSLSKICSKRRAFIGQVGRRPGAFMRAYGEGIRSTFTLMIFGQCMGIRY